MNGEAMGRSGSERSAACRRTKVVQGGVQSVAIACGTQPHDHALREIREVRVVPKRLAPVNIREMHFNERQGHACQGIAKGHAGVRECPGVDDDESGAVGAGGMYAVDQSAFVVALKGRECGATLSGMLGQALVKLHQGGRPVNLRFADAQQIEVGAVKDKNLHVSLATCDTDVTVVREVKPRKSK